MKWFIPRACALATAVAAVPACAQSFVGLISGRGTEAIRLKASSVVTYYSSSGTETDSVFFDSPPVIEINDIGGTYVTTVSRSVTPISGLVKDYGSASVRFAYTNGGPLATDSLSTRLTIHGSAEEAYVGSPLKPANLTLTVAITYVLLGEPDGGLFRLTLPSIPSLHDPVHETLTSELSGPGVFLQRGPGSPEQTVELDSHNNFTFELGYRLDVPFGTDPDYVYDFNGAELAATPVPEPGEFLPVVALGLLGWGLLRRRQGLVK